MVEGQFESDLVAVVPKHCIWWCTERYCRSIWIGRRNVTVVYIGKMKRIG